MTDKQQLQMLIRSTTDHFVQTMMIQGKDHPKTIRLSKYLDILLGYTEELSKK